MEGPGGLSGPPDTEFGNAVRVGRAGPLGVADGDGVDTARGRAEAALHVAACGGDDPDEDSAAEHRGTGGDVVALHHDVAILEYVDRCSTLRRSAAAEHLRQAAGVRLRDR